MVEFFPALYLQCLPPFGWTSINIQISNTFLTSNANTLVKTASGFYTRSLTGFLSFHSFFFFFFFNFWLHWVFVAVHRLFSSCGEWGLLFVAVRGLLIVVASLAAEHRL